MSGAWHARLGSIGAPTLGYVLVGVSAFALLAAGPRLLGPDTYSQLAVTWTIATVFGFGIAVPGEQVVTRAVARSRTPKPASSGVTLRLVLACAPILGLFALSAAGVSLPGVSGPLWWGAATLACAAWALLVGPRGTLAGSGRFGAVGTLLGVEATTRVMLVVVAWLVPQSSELLLALAVGLPMVVAALAATLLSRRAPRELPDQRHPITATQVAGHAGERAAGSPHQTGPEQSALTAVALAMQVLLNSAPLWLAGRSTALAATAGIYVSVTAYLRIPALFTGGSMTVVLSRSSAAHAAGRIHEVSALLARHLGAMGLLTLGLTVGLILAAPIGLTLLYGPELTVTEDVLLLIGTSTVIFAVANIATQSLIATGRAERAAGVWVLAATCATLGLALLPATLAGASLAVLIGVVVGAAGVAWFLVKELRRTVPAGAVAT